jgi:hypothetical protein
MRYAMAVHVRTAGLVCVGYLACFCVELSVTHAMAKIFAGLTVMFLLMLLVIARMFLESLAERRDAS